MIYRKPKAFTLIELLIVVAIIAILAAIAVPNFLEAQVRSKVSSVKTDMRSIATGLEAYRVDYNNYPVDPQWYFPLPTPDYITFLWRITTPVAYMTSIPQDRFDDRWVNLQYPQGDPHRKQFDYRTDYGWGVMITTWWPGLVAKKYKDQMKSWVLRSYGPDQQVNYGEYLLFGETVIIELADEQAAIFSYTTGWAALYDPTNGTMSAGDIARAGP